MPFSWKKEKKAQEKGGKRRGRGPIPKAFLITSLTVKRRVSCESRGRGKDFKKKGERREKKRGVAESLFYLLSGPLQATKREGEPKKKEGEKIALSLVSTNPLSDQFHTLNDGEKEGENHQKKKKSLPPIFFHFDSSRAKWRERGGSEKRKGKGG